MCPVKNAVDVNELTMNKAQNVPANLKADSKKCIPIIVEALFNTSL